MIRVDLPFAGKYLDQDKDAQAVSSVAAALQSAVIQGCDESPRRVLEFGSGCGIVSIMLALQRPLWQITGIEIQTPLHKLALQNAARCEVSVSLINSDIRTFTADEKADLIVSNPPWQKSGSGILSPFDSKNISRFEIRCTMEELLESVKRNLHPSGSAYLIYPRDREKDLQITANKTFLDINDSLAAADLKNHIICHIRHKGMNS
ncbi:MAG: methyltransferase [Candidatus Cloacimonadaceae bacterium]|nr:methyltransferase [Candidatus Cloacimonadaceae bacterium]